MSGRAVALRTAGGGHAGLASGADLRIVAGLALLLSRLLVGPGRAAGPMLGAASVALLAVCVAPGPGSLRSVLAPARDPAPTLRWPAAAGVGLAAVALAAALSGPAPSPAGTLQAVAGSALLGSAAAVAEEALFRGLVYRRLEAGGAGLAVIGSAVLFAAVHVPAYGLGAVPVDLAAGLLLGWQRRATGGLAAPAITHVAANLLAVLR